MSIQDTDLMVVNNNGTTETITFAQFRDGTVLNDSDLFLINGGTQAETVTWGEIKDEIGGATPIDPTPDQITANPDFQGGTGTELDPYILTPVEVRGAGGMVTSVEQLTVQVDPGVQLVQFTDNSVGAGDRFVQPTQATDENGTWVSRLIYRDIPDSANDTVYTGDIQLGEIYFRWVVTQVVVVDVPPVIDRVTLTEQNPDKDPRFTDQSFDAEIFMTTEGDPASNKIWDAYVEGRMSVQGQFKAPLVGTSTSTVDYASTATVDNAPVGQFTVSGTLADCFDGNLGTSYAIQATGLTTALEQTWTFSESPVAGGRSLGVNYFNNNPVTWEGRLKSGGVTANSFEGKYVSFAVPEGDELVGLYFKYVPQGSNVPVWRIYTFEDVPQGTTTSIPGAALVDGDLTVLEFAADTDFSTLEDGDIVTQTDGDFIYSAQTYWSSTVNMSGTVPNAFDGSISTYALGVANTNGTLTYNPPIILSNAQNVRVYCGQGVSVNLYGDAGKSIGSALVAGWVEFVDDNPNINRIEVVGVASSGVGRVMFAAIEVDGVILTDATEITGVVKEIAEPNVTLTAETTGWINGLDVTGPTREVVKDNVKKYLSFGSTGNVQDLLDTPQDPPVFGTNQLTFTFPSTFPSGKTPDEELGEGTTLTVSAIAVNTAGASGPIEATVQPEGPEFVNGWFGPTSVDVAPTKDFRGGCAFGDGVYIAVGYNQIYRSEDGENWTQITTAVAVNNQWTRVGYGGGRFVVVATSSSTQRAAYSTDGGLTWTAGNLAAQAWIDVAYGNGRWIAIAGSGTTKYQRYSDDGGSTWTAQTPPAFANFAKRIIHDGTNFVALSSPTNGQIAYSTNGDAWVIKNLPSKDCQDIAYGDGTYLVTQGSSTGSTLGFSRSTDLDTWETVTTPNMLAQPLQIAYGNGNFVMCGNDSGFKFLVSSDNGDTWTGANGVDQTKIFRYIEFAGDRFIAVSGNMGGTGNRYLDYSFTGLDDTIRSMTEEELAAQNSSSAPTKTGVMCTRASRRWNREQH